MKNIISVLFLVLVSSAALACPVKGSHIHGGTGSHHKGGTCY